MIVYKVFANPLVDPWYSKPVKTFRGRNRFADAIRYAKKLRTEEGVTVYELDAMDMYESRIYLERKHSPSFF